MDNDSVLITGNTYPVKDELKKLGARWHPGLKAWLVPSNQAAEAEQLVAEAVKHSSSERNSCARCGRL